MAVKLGVGGKLLLIMTSTMSLVLVVAVMGVFGFVQVANKQNSVIDDTIPAIVTSHSLSLANSSLVNIVPSISKAATLSEVDTLADNIDRQLGIFVEVADQFQHAQYASGNTAELLVLVQLIDEDLRQQLSWMTAKLYAAELYKKHANRAAKAIAEIESISTSLVANANTTTSSITSGLYDLVESDTDQLYATFDRLIDIDLDYMERMYELRKRATSLNTLLVRLGSSRSFDEVAIIKQQIMGDLDVLQRRIAEINDPGRRRQATEYLRAFNDNLLSAKGYSLFELQTQMLHASSNQQRLAIYVNGHIEDFNKQVILISSSVSDGLIETTEEARKAVALWRDLIFFVSVGIVIIGIAFLWIYLRRSLFRPLDSVNDALLSVAKGDLTAEASYSRDDVIGRLARTVQVFKDNASVRMELEQQREIVEGRLRNHQRELEQQINERTLQLQSVNERLKHSVEDHSRAREEAEQANQAKTAFLATMSHEIRTPLSGILGTLRLLGQTAVNEQQNQYLEYSLEAAEALLSILNGILDFAKVEADEIVIESRPCRLQQIAATLKALMQPVADDKGIEFFINISQELANKHVLLDKGKVHQILFNLVSNAIKFTPSGFVDVSIDLVSMNESTVLRFEVQDTGLGIPAESRSRLFQPFTQYDASTSRRYGGTGLGLSICDKLATAMGGDMGIDSRVPEDYTQGSCCWFEVPAELVDIDGTATTNIHQPATVSEAKHILLVEDNKIGRIVTEGYLQQMGHEVQCAVDGYHALTFAEQDFDVILMDISMPGMDGVETAMKMRKVHQSRHRYIPIIAMSAHIFPQEIEEFLRVGMDGFIGKPFDLQRFMVMLQDIKKTEDKPVSLPVEHIPEVVNDSVLQADLSALGHERMAEMIALYQTSSREIIGGLKLAWKQHNLSALADHAHSLKNAAGSLGLEKLHSLAHQLEQQAKQSQKESVSLIMDDLDAAVSQAEKSLMSWQKQHLSINAGE